MAQCKNCRKRLGCSCKKRTASNGTPCCASCLPALEAKLKQPSQDATKYSKTGVILSAKAEQTK